MAYEEPYAQSDEDFYKVLLKQNSIVDIKKLDMNVKNDKGETPFHIAMKIRNHMFFRLAMNIKKHERGFIDFESVDNKGTNVLHNLAKSKNIPFTVILTSTYLKSKLFVDSRFRVPSELVPVQYFPLRKLFKRCEVNALGFNKIYEKKALLFEPS